MNHYILLIFLISYAGVAFGSFPGLALDRTGFALLGAIAMVAVGALGLGEAVHAIDLSTILLLYGLMVFSAQFRLGGFYTWTVLRISACLQPGRRHAAPGESPEAGAPAAGDAVSPEAFLLILMGVAALFSAVLANDIVCLAFTPVLTVSLLRVGLNPLPFLLGLAMASNIGSAATIIGNPQNMLIGQVLKLDFGRCLWWCAPPSLLALAVAYGVLLWFYRGRFRQAPVLNPGGGEQAWPTLDRWQSTKGLVLTGVLMVLFFTRVPRELSALALAGVFLCSRRMKSRSLLGLVDWHLITLFCGLFIVIKGLETTGLPVAAVDALKGAGLDLHNLHVLTGISVVLSNLVSNVPATMLLVKFMDPSRPVEGYVLALSSTFAGNLITLGSIANLIVIEQARLYGVHISFREHARTGIPVTLLSLAITALWILLCA